MLFSSNARCLLGLCLDMNTKFWTKTIADLQDTLFGVASQVTKLADGTVVIQTCSVVNSGACPEDYGYTCKQRDTSQCGIQFSSTRQSAFCRCEGVLGS